MTLKLQRGMKEDDTMNSAGSIEERNMRRKQSEIGGTPISDDPEYLKGDWPWKFQTNTMENMQFLTKQTNEALQSVGLQLRGVNTTIGKMNEGNHDKFFRMNEKIITVEKR